MNVIFVTSAILFAMFSMGSTSAAAVADDTRISMTEVKKLLHQMLQIAALRKQADEAEIRSSPCPSWLQQRNGCTRFAPFSVAATRSQETGNVVAPSSLDLISDDNVSLNKEYNPALSEATGGGQEPMAQNVPQSEQLMRNMRREGTSRSLGSGVETASMTERMARIFPRFTGRTTLNRPIRVQFSRAPKSGKRALDCIRKCIVEGGLHPVQCHSIC